MTTILRVINNNCKQNISKKFAQLCRQNIDKYFLFLLWFIIFLNMKKVENRTKNVKM